jgi:hypothetical protein
LAEFVPVAQVALDCKAPVVHDKHVVRAPVGHVAHGAVHPVVKTLATHAPAVKVYPVLQAVQVRVEVARVHVWQLVIPVTATAGEAPVFPPAEQEIHPVAEAARLRTYPNLHSVQAVRPAWHWLQLASVQAVPVQALLARTAPGLQTAQLAGVLVTE